MERRALETAGLRRTRLMLAVTLYAATAGSSASAHHSHPVFYEQCRRITIEGRIERVEFKEPHTQIFLRLDDETAYTVDWATLRSLTNTGVIGPAKAALVSGARVVVTGNPIRTLAQIRVHFPDFNGNVNPNTIDLLSIRRVGDSFSSARPAPANPPNCDGK